MALLIHCLDCRFADFNRWHPVIWTTCVEKFPYLCGRIIGIYSDLACASWTPTFFIPTYRRAWTMFEIFSQNLFPGTLISLPISPPTLGLFIPIFSNLSMRLRPLKRVYKLHSLMKQLILQLAT